jgi:hypothetical protein
MGFAEAHAWYLRYYWYGPCCFFGDWLEYIVKEVQRESRCIQAATQAKYKDVKPLNLSNNGSEREDKMLGVF